MPYIDLEEALSAAGNADGVTTLLVSCDDIAEMALTEGVSGLERLNAPPRLVHYNSRTCTLRLHAKPKPRQTASLQLQPVQVGAPAHVDGAAASHPMARHKTSKVMLSEMHTLADHFCAQSEDGHFIRWCHNLGGLIDVALLSGCMEAHVRHR